MSATVRHVNSDPEAVRRLDDGPYLGYVLVQMFRLGIRLIVKRWPEVG